MGGFTDHRCKYCRTEIEEIPFGRTPRCGNCYKENVELPPDDVMEIRCSKCG